MGREEGRGGGSSEQETKQAAPPSPQPWPWGAGGGVLGSRGPVAPQVCFAEAFLEVRACGLPWRRPQTPPGPGSSPLLSMERHPNP